MIDLIKRTALGAAISLVLGGLTTGLVYATTPGGMGHASVARLILGIVAGLVVWLVGELVTMVVVARRGARSGRDLFDALADLGRDDHRRDHSLWEGGWGDDD